jgi:MoaA/NifB/PqqE/SkfB family radical SAM enzyme
MANIGYIQVVRHCNHFCGFCSNPSTPWVHDFATMRELVDDFVRRHYFGVILTGGEPSLHPELPQIVAYARERGLHVRMITNGTQLAEPALARELRAAGLQLVHVSVYSVRPEVEAELRGVPGTLERAFAAIDNALSVGIEVNINSVINALNADHLHENVEHFIEHHPGVRHFVWNNLDPSMGRAEVNQARFTPRLADFEVSLHRALSLLASTGRTFRVEKVPLCYMTDFAWASTETRKIVKGEERIVHFLDRKQTVRQTDWEHVYSAACEACTLRTICGGLFDRGEGYDPAELSPVFVSRDAVVEKIIASSEDPSFAATTLGEWRVEFERRCRETLAERADASTDDDGPVIPVGRVTQESRRRFEARRQAEARRALRAGVRLENDPQESGDEPEG